MSMMPSMMPQPPPPPPPLTHTHGFTVAADVAPSHSQGTQWLGDIRLVSFPSSACRGLNEMLLPVILLHHHGVSAALSSIPEMIACMNCMPQMWQLAGGSCSMPPEGMLWPDQSRSKPKAL